MRKGITLLKRGINTINFKAAKISGFLLMLPLMLLGKLEKAYANEWDFLDDPAPTDAPFEAIESKVKAAGQSAYGTIMAGAMAIMLCGAVIIGVGIAVSHNPNKKSDNKTQLIFYVIGGIVVFGGAMMLAFSKKIANSLAQ